MPKLSIIIPVYNAERFLAETIESIGRQEFRDWEIICVDDCSTDGSRDLLRNVPGVCLLERGSNSGGASAPKNDGIRAANGEYITTFDADDLMELYRLATQVKFLDSHPEADFVFTDFVNFSDVGVGPRHTSGCHQFRSLLINEVGEREYIIDSQGAYKALITENFVGGSSMMFRKKLVQNIGGFDPTLESGEDLDFVFRAVVAGNLGYVDIVGHRRRLHASNVTGNMKKVQMCYLSVLQQQLVKSQDSMIRGSLKRRISEVYWEIGYALSEDGQFLESATMQIQAMKTNWMDIRPYMGLVKLILYSITGRHKPQAIQI